MTPVHAQVPSDCTRPDGCARQGMLRSKMQRRDEMRRLRMPPCGTGEGAMRRAVRANPPSSQRGFVIVAVLWILIALVVAGDDFFDVSVGFRRCAGHWRHGAEGRGAGIGWPRAHDLSADAGSGRQATATQGSFRFRMDDADVAVTFTSEAARIDLNLAPKELLAGLFAALGARKDAAMEDAERIVGWRTRPVPDAVNDEAALYAAAGLNYSPRQSPVHPCQRTWRLWSACRRCWWSAPSRS